MRWSWSVLLLAGCPYVFGGPDLSQVDLAVVDAADADTDADADSDTDADTDTDTDPTATGDTGSVVAPELTDVVLLPRREGALLVFTATDPDGDLEGGELRVDDGDGIEIFRIPDDLAVWNPSGPSTALLLVPAPCAGFDLDLEITISDAAGHAGTPATGLLTVQGFGNAPEMGFEEIDMGMLAPPTLLCANSEYPGDIDRFRFEWPGGVVDANLAWDTNGDIDLFLEEPTGVVVAASVSITPGEQINRALDPSPYVWVIEHLGGGTLPTDWSLLIEVQ